MIRIDISKNEPAPDWLDRADLATFQLLAATSKEERDFIIDTNQSLWTELKQHLSAISHHKCWYSEARDNYVHCHVDHFRPKRAALGFDRKTDYGGYWWLAFEWTNYRYCGPAGNVRKKDYFAVRSHKACCPDDDIDLETYYLLDPIKLDDPLKLTFTEEGIAKPLSTNEEHWDYLRAKYTIENLNLNFENLKEARKEVWKKCSDLILEIENLLRQEQLNPNAVRRQKILGKMERLKEFVEPTSEFSAAAKTCLFSSGLDWAIRIAA